MLPSGTPIYSNDPDIIYILTDRQTSKIPTVEAIKAEKENSLTTMIDSYAIVSSKMIEQIRASDIV